MHEKSSQADELDTRGRSADTSLVQQEPLITVPLSSDHRTGDFKCALSERVANFFHHEGKILIPGNYCRAFIAPNPEDATEVWGYYTLSATVLVKASLSGSDEKRATRNYFGYPVPMVRIGFMGRDDRSPAGLGRGVLIDAARRVYRNGDIAAWGLTLESEGGPQNKKLWEWYIDKGFKPCRGSANSMYGPLSAFLPELHSA